MQNTWCMFTWYMKGERNMQSWRVGTRYLEVRLAKGGLWVSLRLEGHHSLLPANGCNSAALDCKGTGDPWIWIKIQNEGTLRLESYSCGSLTSVVLVVLMVLVVVCSSSRQLTKESWCHPLWTCCASSNSSHPRVQCGDRGDGTELSSTDGLVKELFLTSD